jgi:hypothetical protein
MLLTATLKPTTKIMTATMRGMTKCGWRGAGDETS